MIRALLVAAAFGAATPAVAADTIRFAVTDIEGFETLQQEFGPFRDKLEELTGYRVELFPVGSRTAAVEAMRSGQLEFVLTGPAEYVVIRELTDARIVVGWQRPDYFAQVVALADGPFNSVEKLRGQTVAFHAAGSTSQHLGPAQALADLGLAYGVDYNPQIINRNVAIEAMIRGDLAAVGMNFLHLASARRAYPDVAFTVVARGRDLPNDVLVANANVSDEMFEKVRAVFTDHGEAVMESVLTTGDNDKYRGGFFIATVNDADYDYVRRMYRTIGVETFGQFVGD
jgi:phosphonate transport system substrate-binding protein